MLRSLCPNLFDPPLDRHPGNDFSGAIAGVVASIPQTVGYGLIVGAALGQGYSGVGVVAALYGSIVLGLAGAMFGGCPLIVSGPRASTLLVFAALIVTLKHSAALSGVPDPALAAFGLACLASAAAGLVQVAFGTLRFGRLASYVPLPVVAGFINATAILILLGQVWPATGVPRQPSLLDFGKHLADIQPGTLALTLLTVAAIFAARRLLRSGASLLAAIVAANLVYLAGDMFGYGTALGGGLPALSADVGIRFVATDALAFAAGLQGGELLRLMLPAIASMAILSTLDTLLATAAVDEAMSRHSDASRQVLAEGAGNFVASLFGLLPGSGSMMRTQAALNGGMKSAAAPIGIALFTLAVAMLLGPALPHVSQAVMAGLLMALGIDLFDKWTVARAKSLLVHNGTPLVAVGDLMSMAIVVLVAVVADLATAVGAGIAVALLSFVFQMARSPVRRVYRATALLPRIHGNPARQRFIEKHGREIAVVEVEGALFFGSAAELKKQVDALADEGIVHIAIDMRRVTDVDATGVRLLERIDHRLARDGGILALGYVQRERRTRDRLDVFGRPRKPYKFEPRRIWLKLAYLGALDVIGEDRFFADIDAAVARCETHLAKAVAPTAASRQERPPILSGIEGEALRRLRRHTALRRFAPGETVFAQGSACETAFLLARGRVDILLDLPGTERKLKVQTLNAGSIFGEMALLAPQPRSASVVAREDVHCYVIGSNDMARLKRDFPDVAFTLLANVAVIFAERLRATNHMLSEIEA